MSRVLVFDADPGVPVPWDDVLPILADRAADDGCDLDGEPTRTTAVRADGTTVDRWTVAITPTEEPA